MGRINRLISDGKISRVRYQGGDSISYVIRRGAGDVTSRAALCEEVGGLDDLDMVHYLDQTRRALNKVTAFFIAPAVETALYDTLRSTLFLRQNRQQSLLPEERRVGSLHRQLATRLAAPAVGEAPKKKMRQRKLFEPTQ
jgi:hypothetical protein